MPARWRAGSARGRRRRHSSRTTRRAASRGPAAQAGRYQGSRHLLSATACRRDRGGQMSERTYRVTEIVGTSPEGVEQAIRSALNRAGQTLRHLDWFEVTQIRGQIVDNQVAHYQVGIKLGFRLE